MTDSGGMLQLALKLNIPRIDATSHTLDFQLSEVLVNEWIHDLEQAEGKGRRLSIMPIGSVRRLINHSIASRAPQEKKIIKVIPNEQRRRMGQLYLQAQLPKTSETFSRPNQPAALWMPVHALLCRDRFIFTACANSKGNQSESVLEDIPLHHIDVIGSANVNENSSSEWIIEPCGKLTRQSSSTIFASMRSRRVVDEDQGAFKVETPAPAHFFRSGNSKGDCGASTTADTRFLRLTLSCHGMIPSSSLGLCPKRHARHFVLLSPRRQVPPPSRPPRGANRRPAQHRPLQQERPHVHPHGAARRPLRRRRRR